MKIRKIKTDDITIRLSEPIDVDVSITYDVLGIAGMGKNLNDAIKDFGESFLTKVSGYIMDSDENLTDDAIEIKNKLRALIPDWRKVLKAMKLCLYTGVECEWFNFDIGECVYPDNHPDSDILCMLDEKGEKE